MAEPKIADKQPARLELEAGTYAWCACGESKNQPFCDGSHKGGEFSPHVFTLEEKTAVKMCLCKHTKGVPFCDGSHKGL